MTNHAQTPSVPVTDVNRSNSAIQPFRIAIHLTYVSGGLVAEDHLTFPSHRAKFQAERAIRFVGRRLKQTLDLMALMNRVREQGDPAVYLVSLLSQREAVRQTIEISS